MEDRRAIGYIQIWCGGRSMIDTIYRCEICGTESENPVRWIVIHCSDTQLTVFKWTKEAAQAPYARHYCGEAHAQVYLSRWFESFCG
jgi:hypothetical protein